MTPGRTASASPQDLFLLEGVAVGILKPCDLAAAEPVDSPFVGLELGSS